MLPYYPFYWSDYAGQTVELEQGQHGAYLLLLLFIYTKGKAIPHERRYSIARAGLDEERENVDFILGEFFTKNGENWEHNRANEVIAEQHELHQRRVNAGKKGGKKKSSNARAGLVAPPKPGSSNHNQNQIEDTDVSSIPPKPKKVGFDDLTVDHVRPWLSQKRAQGKFLNVDEDAALEMFKDYCRSSGRKYKDFVAAFRNCFSWNNVPKKGNNDGNYERKLTISERADAAIERSNRALGIID